MAALIPIEQYCEQLIKDDPTIQAEEMLRNLHMAGYGREESVLEVHNFFPLTVDEMCRIVVNEYNDPLIAKDALKDLLLKCGYDGSAVDAAITSFYPRSLGYVLMLDDSNSMHNASAVIKIDAKAFLDCSRTEDQFGVNQFKKDAGWVYPVGDDPAPAVVTEGRDEIKAAETEIDKLRTTGGWTNIAAAVSLGNAMEEKMDTDIKAYVLISDGDHNTGSPTPASVLKDEPPIYIAGLGPCMKKSHFTDMLAKNEKSKFYNSPNAFDMMMVFNQILADSSQSLLLLNHLESCQGTNYSVQEFTISGKGNHSLISVVWSDKKYRYTPGYPSGDQINLVLIDPDSRSTSIQPQIVDDGFCIYDLRNAKPGKWKILSQYALADTVSATSGVLQTDMPILPEIVGTQSIKAGESPEFMLRIAGASLFSDLSATAVYSRPAVDHRSVLQAAHKDGLPESGFGIQNSSLFPRMRSFAPLERCETDIFRGSMGTCENPGIYNGYLTIKGAYKDGTPFVFHKMHSVIVE